MGDFAQASDSLPGRLLKGRYEVGAELGRGGMATVYLARDRDLDRAVVVKVPEASLLRDESFRERFGREVRSMLALHHPHVVKVLDAGEEEGTPFVVLEHLAGGSLKDRLDAKVSAGEREPLPDILAWLDPVARALDSIHARDVVHRDVKPANILFDDEGNPFLSDFGVSKVLGAPDTSLTQTGATPGTPLYMAPEAGRGGPLSGASDQYSLGAILYEALAGFVPLDAETPVAVMVKKLAEDPEPVRKHAPEVPRAAADAVMRALSRDPKDRFPSCAALADALREGLDGAGEEIPVATRIEDEAPPPAAVEEGRATRVDRWRLPVAVAAAVAVAATLFLATRSGPEDRLVVTGPDWQGGGRWTRSNPVTIEGRVDPAGLRELRVGGEVVQPGQDGAFSRSVYLEVGLNSVPVTALWGEGEERRLPVELVLDIVPPKLWLQRPADGLRFSGEPVPVEGRVEDENLDRVLVNGRAVAVAPDGSFSTRAVLEAGETVLRIEVHDRAGNHRVVERTLRR